MTAVATPGDRYWALIDPYWLPLNETWDSGISAFLAMSRQVPPRVLNLYAAHWCESEVNNGGFHQFFSNTTGLLAPEALQGFRAIGLPKEAELLSEAISYFGTPYPRERTARLKQLPRPDCQQRSEWDPFILLDESFYQIGDGSSQSWERAADAYAAA